MSGQIAVIKEKINNLLKLSEKGIIKSIATPSIPETPEPAFATLVEIYKKDEDARAAVDFYAQAIVGSGFHTSCAEGYEEAKRAVDLFAEEVDLDSYLLEVAKEIVAYGNSFTELIAPTDLRDLRILPIDSGWRIHRSKDGTVLKIEQHKHGSKVEFKPEEIIHWRWGAVSAESYGRGILHTLAETLTYTLRFSDGSSVTRVVPPLSIRLRLWLETIFVKFYTTTYHAQLGSSLTQVMLGYRLKPHLSGNSMLVNASQ